MSLSAVSAAAPAPPASSDELVILALARVLREQRQAGQAAVQLLDQVPRPQTGPSGRHVDAYA